VPKVRGQALLKAGEADLMIGFDNAELEAGTRHVAPVASFEVGIVARPGIRLRGLADLRGKTVGQLRSADYFAPLEQDSAILKYSTNTMAQMVKMLALGRVDAVVGVRESLYYAFQSEGISPERIGDFLALGSREAWLHYANASYDATMADKLAAAMQRMRAGGSIAAIIARYVRK
jgi:ABC-type amino acid transport substrate-binding protein